MKLAINQPYFFPYIGFFQLVSAVSKFVSLEDVNYIKRGWINRNRILINGMPSYISLEISDASQNRKINETHLKNLSQSRESLLKTLRTSYSRAPYFTRCSEIVEDTLDSDSDIVSDISLISIRNVCKYIGLKRNIEQSNSDISDVGVEKLIAICKSNNADTYINLPGGMSLYNKETFADQGIELKFIQPVISEYKQFSDGFVPGLSIIDVMMFNHPERILEMTSEYSLI